MLFLKKHLHCKPISPCCPAAARPQCRSAFIPDIAPLVLLIIMLVLLQTPEASALVCGTPGSAGPGSPTGVVNDYWSGSGSPSAGSTSISLGSRRSSGAGNSISPGDLVLIIQMQDANIRTNNNSSYGGNDGTGSGATDIRNAGRYEYVRATNSVSGSGGNLNFTPALTYQYSTRTFVDGNNGNGQSRWQAIRVPQYSTATASNVTAPAWNGATGGVVAMDVEGNLTLSGGTAISVAGLGFRGGAGRQLSGGSGSDSDFRTRATIATNASKGEGIAGTPRYVNGTTSYNAAPTVTTTGVEDGYPNGSYARGAPGNAGGGGTDGNPSANDQNSGGGGGSNYGYGGQGGDAWSSGDQSGGRGGADFDADLSPNRVFLGGGGGAGTTNNGTSDNAIYSNPSGVACTAGNGACSSGTAGGGLVLIRAGSISGGGLIDARGADAYNVGNDGGGGGGGGGTVVLQSYFGGNASVDVSGGNGGNTWRSQNSNTDRHGPGGGGGGGYVAYSPSSGFTVNAAYSAGLSGRSSNDDPYGSSSGNGGFSNFDLTAVPGIQPGYLCQPAIKAVSIAVDSGTAGAVDLGDTVEYTIVYQNISSSPITGFNITDTLATGLNFVPGSLTVTPSDGASGSARSSYNGTSSTRLLASNVTFPVGGVITARLRALVDASSCGDVFNQASAIQGSGQNLGLTDNADSDQNAGALPAGNYISQSPYGTSGASDPTGFSITCPDLATSTKMWAGNTEPGDTLTYTITLTNSGGGYATGVTITDPIDPNFNWVGVNVCPTGASCDYSAGQLSVTNVSVPAGESVTIAYDVRIAPGTSAGTMIDNSATITTPYGIEETLVSQTVIVSDPAPIPSGTGNKPLYLDGSNDNPRPLTRSMSGNTDIVSINRGWVYPPWFSIPGVDTWTLDPPLQLDMALDDNASPQEIQVKIWLASENSGYVRAQLTCGNNISLDSNNIAISDSNGAWFQQTISLQYADGLICNQSEVWTLSISNLTNSTLQLDPDRNSIRSQVVLPSATVINIDNLTIQHTDGSGSPFAAGDVVRIRAEVSDPFGFADITSIRFVLTDPDGNQETADETDTRVSVVSASGAIKTYEFDYEIPSKAPPGEWDVTVTAFEGEENPPDQVKDTKSGTFEVRTQPPSLMVVKSATHSVTGDQISTATPGQVITYTVQVVNTGDGMATNVVLTDHMSPYTAWSLDSYGAGQPFQLIQGSPASGLSLGVPEYSDNDGTDWNYDPTSGAGGAQAGYDGNVTNWRIPMAGTMNADSASFTLRYRVQVK